MKARGFTLIELLIAMAVLSIITGIVFSCFFAVTDSVELARDAAEEVRFVQFLNQYFNTNLASAFYDLRAMSPIDQFQEEAYFIGEDAKGRLGPADVIEFFSTAPLLGGMGLPGDLKLVRIEVLKDDKREGVEAASEGVEDKPYVLLQVTESSLAQGRASGSFGALDDADAARPAGELGEELAAAGDMPSSWQREIQSFDVQYFDGKDWLEEWDWEEKYMMPWAVHIRMNFWRPEAERDAEKEAGLDLEDDPDYECVVAIPSGMTAQLLPEEFAQAAPRAPFPAAPPGQSNVGTPSGSGNDSRNAGERSDRDARDRNERDTGGSSERSETSGDEGANAEEGANDESSYTDGTSGST